LRTPLRSAMPDVRTLPEHFKLNGYETVSIGKVYHHADDDRQGWSAAPYQSKGDWRGRGYLTDEALAALEANAARMHACGVPHKAMQVGAAYEAADVGDADYQDGKDAQVAVAQLRRLAAANRRGRTRCISRNINRLAYLICQILSA